jgi:hypothetical protein
MQHDSVHYLEFKSTLSCGRERIFQYVCMQIALLFINSYKNFQRYVLRTPPFQMVVLSHSEYHFACMKEIILKGTFHLCLLRLV